MSDLVPVTTATLGASPEVAAKIVAGIGAGEYERVGGVIRSVGSKEIVAWLRTVPESRSVDLATLSKLGPLLQLGVAASALNLSISAIGFGAILRSLHKNSQALARMERKLDQISYSRFHSALVTAQGAFGMRDATNKSTTLGGIIHPLNEAQDYYLGMVDHELEGGSRAVSPFLNSAFLACVSTARCHLELGEAETAWKHLQDSKAKLSQRVEQYYDLTVKPAPAIFLHPELAKSISLERLTRLQRHYEPNLLDKQVFERLRSEIWETARTDQRKLKLRPSFLWNKVPGRSRTQNFDRLAETFEQVEAAHGFLDFTRGYEIEVKYMLDHNIDYHSWQQFERLPAGEADPVLILLPEDSQKKE